MLLFLRQLRAPRQYQFDPLDDPAVERSNWPLIQIPNIAKIQDATLRQALADIKSLLAELNDPVEFGMQRY